MLTGDQHQCMGKRMLLDGGFSTWSKFSLVNIGNIIHWILAIFCNVEIAKWLLCWACMWMISARVAWMAMIGFWKKLKPHLFGALSGRRMISSLLADASSANRMVDSRWIRPTMSQTCQTSWKQKLISTPKRDWLLIQNWSQSFARALVPYNGWLEQQEAICLPMYLCYKRSMTSWKLQISFRSTKCCAMWKQQQQHTSKSFL